MTERAHWNGEDAKGGIDREEADTGSMRFKGKSSKHIWECKMLLEDIPVLCILFVNVLHLLNEVSF